MRFVDEYRNEADVRKVADSIRALVTRPWTLMEICGGQTHTLIKYGLDRMLPELVTLVHGPGCPVCVTPLELIDRAVAIAERPDVTFCSFGDMLRVPGSRVDLLSVKARGGDVRCFVRELERWVIDTLAEFNVTGEIRDGRVGVWVQRPDRPGPDGKPAEDKIAALGIKLRRWVSFHGIAINVEPDLSHFDGIIPCGIRDHGVTSLVDLGLPVTMADLDAALRTTFPRRFQGTCPAPDAA